MQDDNTLHDRIKDIMLDVMAVLYENGIKQIHMGAMMRLLGVADEAASQHDDEMIELDEKFADMLAELNKNSAPVDIPAGTTFH